MWIIFNMPCFAFILRTWDPFLSFVLVLCAWDPLESFALSLHFDTVSRSLLQQTTG